MHGDLKPQNILLNLRGEARVSDFGCVAELQDSFGKCGTFVGTVPYMSPERIQGQSYSYASDIWALGLTLHECAVGHFPYARRQGYWGILQAMIKEPSPSLATEEGHPPTLCDFVDQCLRKDLNLRPAAKELQAHAFVGEGSSGFDLPGYSAGCSANRSRVAERGKRQQCTVCWPERRLRARGDHVHRTRTTGGERSGDDSGS